MKLMDKVTAKEGLPLKESVRVALEKIKEDLSADTPILLENVRIFSSGTFQPGNLDRPITFSDSDIETILNSTNEIKKDLGFVPFAKLTHQNKEEHDKNPYAVYPYSLGYSQDIWKSGKYVLSNFEVPLAVCKDIEKGKIRNVSVELHSGTNPDTGKKYGLFFKAIALLGSNLEALWATLNKKPVNFQSIDNITINLNDNEELNFSFEPVQEAQKPMEQIMQLLQAIASKMGIQTQRPQQQPDMANMIQEKEKDIEMGKKQQFYHDKEDNFQMDETELIEKIKAQVSAEFSAKETSFQKELEARDNQIKALTGIVTAVNKEKDLNLDKEFVYKFTRDNDKNLIDPAVEEKLLKFMGEIPDTRSINFSADGQSEASMKEGFKSLITDIINSKSAAVFQSGELAPNFSGIDSKDLKYAQDRGIDPESYLLDQKVQQYAAKNNLDVKKPNDYLKALSAVSAVS